MIILQELCSYLDKYLSANDFIDYCFNGMQVEGKKEILRLGTAVSASLETIEKAVAQKCDALIVHHGLFWNRDAEGLKIQGSKKEKLKRLLENEISLLAYHLPLDAHTEVGNNWKAAKDLDWSHLEPFGILNKIAIGVKGSFAPISIDQFVKKLENYYLHNAVTALGGKKEITSAALISGGAYKEVLTAAREGVDCFITGNFDEPAWHHAFEEKIHFVAMGHTATERIGPQALAQHLASRFGIECEFLDLPNPF